MTDFPHDPAGDPDAPMSALLDDLARKGWHVRPDFIAEAWVAALREECLARQQAGVFHAAGVGSGEAKVLNEVRGDHIHWLDEADPHPAVSVYLRAMADLREAVNASFFLGLFELEAHFAAYPAGAGYQRHLDRFRDDDRRTLTAIVYLNEAWHADDGGALRLWPDPSGQGAHVDILPRGGTLVTFLSDRFWHEVQPARRQRLALTGWFRRR